MILLQEVSRTGKSRQKAHQWLSGVGWEMGSDGQRVPVSVRVVKFWN